MVNLKLSFDLIRRYIVLYFLPKTSILLLTNDKIKGLIGSQDGANIPSSVPTSLHDPAINLYKSAVDFIYFRRLVEWALKSAARTAPISIGQCLQVCFTCRLIFIHRWLISFMFIVSWNPPFSLSKILNISYLVPSCVQCIVYHIAIINLSQKN